MNTGHFNMKKIIYVYGNDKVNFQNDTVIYHRDNLERDNLLNIFDEIKNSYGYLDILIIDARNIQGNDDSAEILSNYKEYVCGIRRMIETFIP